MALRTTHAILMSSFAPKEVEDEFFGGIAINQTGFDDYLADSQHLDLGFIRFPGGALSELGRLVNGKPILSSDGITLAELQGPRDAIAYDLTHPELIAPSLLLADERNGGGNDVGSLSDVFAHAVEIGGAVSVILPVQRYFGGIDMADPAQRAAAVAQAKADVAVFLQRLESGAFNGGNYPEKVILEIGNETYSNPIEYAIIARAVIETILSDLSDAPFAYEIAAQMSIGSKLFGDLDAKGYFDRFFDDSGRALIAGLDDAGFDPAATLGFQERIDMIDRMMIAVMGDSVTGIDLLRHHYLAADVDALANPAGLLAQRGQILDTWRAGIDAAGGDGAAAGYYASAWTVDSGNVGPMAFGRPAAVNAVALLGHLIAQDVERAAAWGITGACRLDIARDSGTVITTIADRQTAPAAEVLRLMAEKLPGMSLLLTDAGNGITTRQADDYLLQVYGDADEIVAFVAVGDLAGPGLEIALPLGHLGATGVARIDMVGTASNAALSGPAVVTTTDIASTGGTVRLTFDQDWSVARIVLSRRDMTDDGAMATARASEDAPIRLIAAVSTGMREDADELQLVGTANASGTGNARDNLILGNAGANRLNGGSGDDMINGGAGADRLIGGRGQDALRGSAGADSFVFTRVGQSTDAAPDTILDFTRNADAIHLGRIDADVTARGNQAFDLIGRDGFSGLGRDSAGELRWERADGNVVIEGDTNGDGMADLSIVVANQAWLCAADFIL